MLDADHTQGTVLSYQNYKDEKDLVAFLQCLASLEETDTNTRMDKMTGQRVGAETAAQVQAVLTECVPSAGAHADSWTRLHLPTGRLWEAPRSLPLFYR